MGFSDRDNFSNRSAAPGTPEYYRDRQLANMIRGETDRPTPMPHPEVFWGCILSLVGTFLLLGTETGLNIAPWIFVAVILAVPLTVAGAVYLAIRRWGWKVFAGKTSTIVAISIPFLFLYRAFAYDDATAAYARLAIYALFVLGISVALVYSLVE